MKPSNIQMPKAGDQPAMLRMVCLPASDLGRWKDRGKGEGIDVN
jgi:hypothetical protein